MSRILQSRYPDPPKNLDPEGRSTWVRLIQLLEQRDRDFFQGRERSIQIEQIKDGVFAKSFTTVISSPYYCKQEDGVLLVDTSVIGGPAELFLTSAIDSRFASKVVKRIAGSETITVQGIDNAEIDFSTSIVVSTTVTHFNCDGKQWWVL